VANNIKVILIDQTGAEYDVSYIQEIPISLNLLIADVRSPDKRNASFSKTITFPGTKEIDRFFSLIWKINLELTSFDPRLKCGIRYYVNEKIQLKGDLQLLNIEVDALSKEVTYFTSATGTLGNLFIAIGDKLITGNVDSALDIDISAADHTLNQSTVVGTWTAPFSPAFVYGLIDYGKNLGNPSNFKIEHFRPALRKKFLLDKIFTDAGYTYTSNFLNSTEYFNFVLPATEENLLMSATDIANNQFYAGRVTTEQTFSYSLTFTSSLLWYYQTVVAGGSVIPVPPTISHVLVFNNDSTAPYNDPSGSYNTSTGGIQFPFFPILTRNYNSVVNFYLVFNTSVAAASCQYNGNVNLRIGSTVTTIAISGLLAPPTTQNVFTSFVYQHSIVHQTFDVTYVGNPFNVRFSLDYLFNVNLLDASNNPISTGTVSIDVKMQTGSFFNASLLDNNIIEGGTVEMNQILPTQTKQIDFLTSEIKLHNLYMEVDPDNDKNYIIEPRESFYSGELDWSDKLDLSRKYKVGPVSLLDAKRYEYTYQTDSDKYNKDYFETYKEVYGFNFHDNVSDFVKPTVKTDVIYASTPIVGNSVNGLVIPKLYKEDNNQIKNLKCKIRSLYFGGLINLNYGSWNLITSTGTTNYNYYPYVGHNDNPYTPTKDYNWGLPKHVYYTFPNLTYTDNNLYNRFYSRQVNQLTDQNSRVVTAWFNLDELDIKNFTFRNVIYVGTPLNSYFYVNKIMDYNVMARQSTQVELLKLTEYDSFTPTELPPVKPQVTGIKNIINESGATGLNNTVAGRFSNITGGSGNFIAEGAENVQLINCTNVSVEGNVTNFVGIGLNGNTIIGIDSGKTINNSYVAPPTNKTLLVQNDFTIDGTYSTYLIDTSITGIAGVNLICTWPVAFTGLEITFKIIDATGGFEITSDDTALTIDGNALPYDTGLVLYDSLTVFMNNINNEMYIVY
jgi:hypothetical protein